MIASTVVVKILCALLDKNSDSYVICTMLMHVYLFFAVFTGKNR